MTEYEVETGFVEGHGVGGCQNADVLQLKMNYNVPQAFLFPFPFDRKMVSGDIKSHFELTLAISKKLAEMQKKCKLASFITQFG